MADEEILKLIGDKSQEGINKLLTRFYGAEWSRAIGSTASEKVIDGMAGVIWAHAEAPYHALNGDEKKAVDSAVGAIGSLAGGIIGGPIGAIVGATISKAPGFIIDYFDTTQIQFNVVFSNVSPYHIRFSSNQTDFRNNFSIMVGYLPEKEYCYNTAVGVFLPKPVMLRKSSDKVEQFAASVPMYVNSKWAYVSFQLEGVDDDGNVKKTYDICFKYPGSWPFENYYVGVFEDKPWPRKTRDNYDAIKATDDGKQKNFGKGNRPRTGTSNKSVAYWESKDLCIFELA